MSVEGRRANTGIKDMIGIITQMKRTKKTKYIIAHFTEP